METFAWKVVSNDYAEKTEFAAREVQFGDGYKQIQPMGINNKKREIQASITQKKATIQQIAAFFDRHAGVRAFLFNGAAMRVTSYQVTSLGGDVFRISFTLKEK